MLSGRPGRRIAFFRNLDAALRSRVLVTKLSSTSPSWSTARQRKCISPLSITYISSRCHRCWRLARIRSTHLRRISAAHIGPNLFHHKRTVSWLISMPRSWRRSSTLRRDSGNRTYIITARRMISGLVLKWRKGEGQGMSGCYPAWPAGFPRSSFDRFPRKVPDYVARSVPPADLCPRSGERRWLHVWLQRTLNQRRNSNCKRSATGFVRGRSWPVAQ